MFRGSLVYEGTETGGDGSKDKNSAGWECMKVWVKSTVEKTFTGTVDSDPIHWKIPDSVLRYKTMLWRFWYDIPGKWTNGGRESLAFFFDT